MKSLLLPIFFFFAVTQASCSEPFNRELKQKLRFELNALEIIMMTANNEIAQLREDKQNIDVALKNMESWGKQQEQEKNEYYSRVIETTNNVAIVQAKVDLEKEKGKATLIRYHRVKSLLGYIFGIVLAYLYTQVGAQFITLVASAFAGPWAYLLRFVGPAAAFGLGYLAVNLFF